MVGGSFTKNRLPPASMRQAPAERQHVVAAE